MENPFARKPDEVETGSFSATPTEPPRGRNAAAGDVVGSYRLISELGRGGMGAVWLAERTDGQLKRQVALKLPHLAWGGALAERLTRERDILASLEHAHIARLYDAGVDREGRPYLAMEYVEGQPIDVYCRERALPLRERIDLLLQVAAAVAHAHARLVVHRDLKPGNILVTADGQVQLLDFGIAKLMEGDRTEKTFLTELAGRALTPDYASPEQIRGEPLGTASDVYSLGAVAYELLTGTRPYRLKRGTPAELEEAITSIDAPRASEAAKEPALRRQLKGDLDAILNKALKKDSGQRYATVEAFAEDLRRHLNQQPVLAQPDRFGYRARKFVRRYRLQVAAGIVVALALLAGAGVALWQAQRARAQAARAEEVKRLVLSIFKDADTAGGGTRKTSAADLLEQARARLAAVPVSDPAVRAELLTSVGVSLVGLGEYKQATEVLEDATKLAVAQLGAGHRETINAQLALGEALIEIGDIKRAGAHLDAAERGMRRTGDTAGLVNALRWKANLRVQESRFDEAIAAATEAVQLAEARLVATNKRIVMLANHTLAGTRMDAGQSGRLEPARRTYELAREIDGGRVTVDLLNGRSLYTVRARPRRRSAEGRVRAETARPAADRAPRSRSLRRRKNSGAPRQRVAGPRGPVDRNRQFPAWTAHRYGFGRRAECGRGTLAFCRGSRARKCPALRRGRERTERGQSDPDGHSRAQRSRRPRGRGRHGVRIDPERAVGRGGCGLRAVALASLQHASGGGLHEAASGHPARRAGTPCRGAGAVSRSSGVLLQAAAGDESRDNTRGARRGSDRSGAGD